jgi:hypothetical protein
MQGRGWVAWRTCCVSSSASPKDPAQYRQRSHDPRGQSAKHHCTQYTERSAGSGFERVAVRVRTPWLRRVGSGVGCVRGDPHDLVRGMCCIGQAVSPPLHSVTQLATVVVSKQDAGLCRVMCVGGVGDHCTVDAPCVQSDASRSFPLARSKPIVVGGGSSRLLFVQM